ncbi:MAG: response regulator [Myxococcales bacterium]|nr:response regulator [Myxococcales bacterium]
MPRDLHINAKTILIIDESVVSRRSLRHVLTTLSCFRIWEACDEGEALAMLGEHSAAINGCLVGLHLVESSLSLVQTCRRAGFFKPMIVLSSTHSPPLLGHAREVGATDWLRRPVSPEHLFQALHQIL